MNYQKYNDPRYYLLKKQYDAQLRNKKIMNQMILHEMIQQQTKNKFLFIHPTKVGGSAFIKYTEKYYPNYFEYKGHDFKTSNSENPILFIRDPYDRFCSMYKYWKYGSIDYEPHQHSEIHIEKVKKYNIKDFIQFVKEKNSILITSFTSFTHIRPQKWWINENDYKKCIIILYDKNKMEEKIFDLLNDLENKRILKNNKFPLTRVNVSNHNQEKIILDENDQKEIYNIYKDDFELIQKIKNEPQLFKKVF
jgi:hypothetical protein